MAAPPWKTITTPKELAARLAQESHRIRDCVARAFRDGRPPKSLLELRTAYASAWGNERAERADTAQFADTLAQTLVYLLFALRCAHPAWPSRSRAARAPLPTSNPFLCRLFETILRPDGAELVGLAGMRQWFQNANLTAVFESVGERNQGLDPIDRFYELFLAAYDPHLQKVCGVYSTPGPVVSFIVRAVDDLLKRGLGARAGLAETKVPLAILDPACGTGNFLSGVIERVRDGYTSPGTRATAWSRYVRKSLLPRMHGCEVLPMSHAVAHLQLGRRLAGHDLPPGRLRKRCTHEFSDDEHLRVYITHSFDEVAQRAAQLVESLSEQSAQTNANPPILVVLGNPPYRGISADHGQASARLLEDYRQVDTAPLGEKKVWLRNAYVQFLRLGHWCIERAGRGILGFVTDHSYLDSPTFRGMRHQLLKTFDEIYILNLHGNAKRREQAPDGGKDDNVFDIKQGVAIALFVRKGKDAAGRGVFYQDLWGSRQAKLARLAAGSLKTIRWTNLAPASPGFEFVPVQPGTRAEYHEYWPVKDVFARDSQCGVFSVGSNGVQTSRDHLVIAFSKKGLRERLESFLALKKSDHAVRREFFGDKSVANYAPGDTRQWQLGQARNSLRQTSAWYRTIAPYQYRPFDQRFLLYLDAMVDWPRREVMRHLEDRIGQPNYALCIGRAGLVTSGTWDLVFCVDKVCDHNLFYRGSSINFPLYLHTNGEGPPAPNLCARFVEKITERLGLRWTANKSSGSEEMIGPESVLHYAYAVLHSPTYRRRYGEFLKYDFPRLPLLADKRLFRALCWRGAQLVGLHLLRKRPPTRATFPVKGENSIRRLCYVEPDEAAPQGRVWINPTQYFDAVPPEVWRFRVGGYPVCQKWLKDRKGMRLSPEDRARYCQIVGALGETIRLMDEIDAVIAEHGGWPIR
jgi:predicted helicase